MSRRERQVSWAIITCSTVFIVWYLLRFGPAAYGKADPLATFTPPLSAATTPSPRQSGVPAESVPARPSLAPPPVRLSDPPAAGPPRLSFAQPVFDFGTLYQDEQVTHEFAFENTGKAPLKIERVTTSCGCTVARPPTEEIAPGARRAITVTFSSGSLRDRVTKHVYVTSNDPANPRVTLTVTGQVLVEVDVVPTGVYFGTLHVGERVTRAVVIQPAAVKRFKVLGQKSNDPAITVAPPVPAGAPEPEGSLRIGITVGPVTEAKQISGRVVLRTDLARRKEISISVYGRVVAAEPEQETRHDPAPASP